MNFWKRLLKHRDRDLRPQRLDYMNEALALERQGDFDAALTSYRLALRDHPSDPRILQNIAIAFSKADQQENAIRSYQEALEIDHELMGAHYGLAFLLLRRGESTSAAVHLKAFLANPPKDAEAQQWIDHARHTLVGLGHPGGT